MFDRSAIEELTKSQSIDAANNAAAAAVLDGACGTLVLPDDYKVHDLEANLPTRRRARGTMTTATLVDFADYVATHAEHGCAVFANADFMEARAVLNLGSPGEPGHADNVAIYKPATTAAYDAIKAIESTPTAQRRLGQRALAEWLEDWATCITCRDATGSALDLPQAIAAVRAITIESARKAESVEGALSAERSSFESVKAHARTPLPHVVEVRCQPYSGMTERSFALRLSVYPDDKTVQLALRMARPEWHREQMAAELVQAVRDALPGAPVAQGTYSATR